MNEADKKRIIDNAVSFVNELFENEFSGHDSYHTFRVLRIAQRLAKEEGADGFIVQLAALLHDVDDVKLSPETSAGLYRARRFMLENHVESETAEAVCTAIREISFKGRDSAIPSTIEGKCVQDADRLDALGAIGVARTFAYGGSRNRLIYDPESAPKTDMSESEYRNSRSSSIGHFYEKLFLLKDMMNTPSAKKLAEERDRFMHGFVDEFLNEWNGLS